MKRIKESYFYADTHVDHRKVRAAVSLERILQELPNEESFKYARFVNQTLQHCNIYIKDLKRLVTRKEPIARMVEKRIYDSIDRKELPVEKIKSLLKSIVHAKFNNEIFDINNK